MRTVITISLNGNAYQLDAAAFEALRAYLDVAEQRLAGNPDQAEILADLEQAIADKCGRYLSPHKNVISADEVAQVIREMGPVDVGSKESAAAGQGEFAGAPGEAGAMGGAGATAANPAIPGARLPVRRTQLAARPGVSTRSAKGLSLAASARAWRPISTSMSPWSAFCSSCSPF